MSYCRMGDDSNVYVIRNMLGTLECLACRISGEPKEDGLRYGYFAVDLEDEMIEHLLEHRRQGWKVPERAIERLRREAGK